MKLNKLTKEEQEKFHWVITILVICLLLALHSLYYQLKDETPNILSISCESPRPCYNPYFNISTDPIQEMYIEPYTTLEVNTSDR